MAHPQIATFARLAKGGEPPKRVIYGQPTRLGRTVHDIRYNERRDEIVITNPFAQAVLTFKGDANGQSAPVRIIQGPKTQLGGNDTVGLDPVNDEVLVPDPVANDVKIFSAVANGDVAPIRILQGGPEVGWRVGHAAMTDYVHDLIVTDGIFIGVAAKTKPPFENPYGGGRDALFIFPRKAEGQVKPLRFIHGDKAGIYGVRQIDVYSKGGWILVAQITSGVEQLPKGAFVGIWSVFDNGNVAPRWKIDTRAGNVLTKPRGVSYDAAHREVLVSDMRLNAVLTFYLPEMF